MVHLSYLEHRRKRWVTVSFPTPIASVPSHAGNGELHGICQPQWEAHCCIHHSTASTGWADLRQLLDFLANGGL